MNPLPFAKLHVAGNHFVVVDGRDQDLRWAPLAEDLSRSSDGVGADGLLVLTPSGDGAIGLRIFNADGSEAEMSGNGLLIASKYASDRRWPEADGDVLTFHSPVGERRVSVQREDGWMRLGEVDLGRPTDVVVRDLATAVGTIRTTCFSLGNPHCVLLADEPLTDDAFAQLGPAVERHPSFPNRVNFAAAHGTAPNRLGVRLYERGVGETRSSGTGSTAAAFAALFHGRVDPPVTVDTIGGTSTVRRDQAGALHYQGEPVEVLSGSWSPTPTEPPTRHTGGAPVAGPLRR